LERLRILVAGFITIDTIQLPVRTIMSVGGPPAYAGLTVARFGFNVSALTKVGADFPDDQSVWLARNGIALSAGDRSQTKKTTRFTIKVNGTERAVYLNERCEDISAAQLTGARFDASLVSPIAGEISPSLLSAIAKCSDFTFLDPQGFVRRFSAAGEATVGKLRDEGILRTVDALKMDREEATAITGKSSPVEALTSLAARGLRKAVVTQGAETCFVLDGTRIFKIPVPKVQIVDTTGAGDILAGGLVANYVRTRDFLWSAAFGVAASSLSLRMIALGKVDLPMTVDDEARRLYSMSSPAAFA
jgi:sugar/nucleoside kinase (ribokinase family)